MPGETPGDETAELELLSAITWDGSLTVSFLVGVLGLGDSSSLSDSTSHCPRGLGCGFGTGGRMRKPTIARTTLKAIGCEEKTVTLRRSGKTTVK